MGNCCKASSSMEWDGEDWGYLKSPSHKVSPKASRLDHHQNKENHVLRKLRDSCDANGKVTLKISKCDLAELLGAIQQNNNNTNNQQQTLMKKNKRELASAEEVLLRLMKARNNEIVKKHHCSSSWKSVLDIIPE